MNSRNRNHRDTHVAEKAGVIAMLSPLCLEEAISVVKSSESEDTPVIDILAESHYEDKRTARQELHDTVKQSIVLAESGVENLNESISTYPNHIAPHGLTGIELYVGTIGSGKTISMKYHITELLNMKDPPAIIVVNPDEFNQYTKLLNMNLGKKYTVGEDSITTPKPGRMQLWTLKNGLYDDTGSYANNELQPWIVDLIDHLRSITNTDSSSHTVSHNIVLCIDDTRVCFPDDYRIKPKLPDSLSIRATIDRAGPTLDTFSYYPGTSRFHIHSLDPNRTRANHDDMKHELDLTELEYKWATLASPGTADRQTEILIKTKHHDKGEEKTTQTTFTQLHIPDEKLNAIKRDSDSNSLPIETILERSAQTGSAFSLSKRSRFREEFNDSTVERREELSAIADKNYYDISGLVDSGYDGPEIE